MHIGRVCLIVRFDIVKGAAVLRGAGTAKLHVSMAGPEPEVIAQPA